MQGYKKIYSKNYSENSSYFVPPENLFPEKQKEFKKNPNQYFDISPLIYLFLLFFIVTIALFVLFYVEKFTFY